MQMSLLGARDMSIINTSPKDRLPIRTEIVEFHPDAIAEAILAEVERGGQVYFVHNRVQSIMSIYKYLARLLPSVRICVGHGQMPERELEDVMKRFLSKDYEVLLSTSIIESGLDIPSVNTIIVNRADRFGLAQMYQLRGRVGRSSLKAVAYLVIPPVRMLTATARKRLKAIEQHSDLGSGFHLAMRDLEIRGAGNMLGPQQHGFIEEVGFDLYLKLLDEAVRELRGEEPKPSLEVKIETDLDMFLPSRYVNESQQKVDIYQRLAQADSYEIVHDLELELIDRYGPLPAEAENLIRMAEIKILAVRAGVEKVVLKAGKLYLSYAASVLPGKRKVAVLASQVPDPLEFSSGGRFEIMVDFSARDRYIWHEQVKNILQNLVA
jgi:transcription-repair coupling factor (superfamily II helicase)